MNKNILSIILFLAIHSIVNGQSVDLIQAQVNENDTVIIKLLEYVGEIQWQSSQDTISWADMENENSDSLLIIVNENLYFRAKVTVGICDPFYSDIAYIENAWNIDNDSDGYTENQGDCNDSISEINPGATEIPNNNVDEDCDGIAQIIDSDNDGYNSDEDCNDQDSLINPAATEIPNNDIDEDCDGIAQIIDSDNDGYNSDEDCNDENRHINPGAIEIPNNDIDEDCDGIALIIDADNDGYNSDEDCNDQDSLINPGAIENECCDGIDQDCDGLDCPIDYDILDTVCGGYSLNCSGLYDEEDEFYKIILLNDEGDQHEWNLNLPSYCQPFEKNEVELIACISSTWITIETCSYGAGGLYKLYRKRNKVTISFHIASTGSLLASETFYGGYPEECLYEETFYGFIKIKSGSPVEYDDVEDWLLGIIRSPVVITKWISDLTHNSVRCEGEIMREDNFLVSNRGVCWSTTPVPTVDQNSVQSGLGIGLFEVEITGLVPDTRYYIRAYAITSKGDTLYGEQISFTTYDGAFTDSRDGRTYGFINAGTQTWMSENLAYLPEVCAGIGDCGFWVYDYQDNSVDDSKSTNSYEEYGVLYNYTTALTGCPSGWHLPSDNEWKQLEIFLGMSPTIADYSGSRGTNEGGKLKEMGTTHWADPNTGALNEIGFRALPGGYRIGSGSFYTLGDFKWLGQEGRWWSSTERNSNSAWLRFTRSDTGKISRYDMEKDYGFSVRCIKD